MKSKLILFALASIVASLVLLMPTTTMAQEGELQVVDEVIAQINDDVITLSMLKRESKERIESSANEGIDAPFEMHN